MSNSEKVEKVKTSKAKNLEPRITLDFFQKKTYVLYKTRNFTQ